MARIKKEGLKLSDSFSALEQKRYDMRELNDCALKAVALVTGASYEAVHAYFKGRGRKDGAPTPRAFTMDAIGHFGKKYRYLNARYDFILKYPSAHQILKGVTTHHPARFHNVWKDGKTYLLFTQGHVLAVINGVNHDWTVGRALRVKSIVEVM